MSIKYDPENIFRGGRPAIDGAMAKRAPKTVSGGADTTGAALDVTISANNDWQLDTMGFQFSNATSRSFSASVVGGRKILKGYNDALWFQLATTLPQRIVLDEGFYNGTTLAVELHNKLEANAAFIAAGVNFTVAYDASTGLFLITPNASTIRYYQVATQGLPAYKNSTGGYMFGLTATTSLISPITSDTAVYGLNMDVPFIAQTGSTALTYFHDTSKTLSVDQGIRILSQVAGVAVTYEITYEEIV